MPRTFRQRTIALTVALISFAHALAVAQQRQAIPTPESVFGFPIGKDSNLVDYEQSIGYF